ncbi:MAG: hypothetical protein HYX68_12205 [Planctomycetes bacterium]|nr:hypothetical protein [Planctomycetota bacterium]
MKRFIWFCAFVSCSSPLASAQEAGLPQFLHALKPRCIGPANMSGRITEVAVYEKEPRIMYVASATGGLWKTINNGTTFRPVFERGATVSLGAVAVCQSNPDLVWLGTGEANARNSVSWGDGVYKSTDGGKSWQHMGLKATEHIGRIVIHPTNPDIVYVAALGKLWGPNLERGVFKTSDAGKTWQHVLALNADTGCIDLAIDPADPDLLYAAMYHVRRDAFSGGNPVKQTGPGSGLYKTTDGGKSWARMAGGLPNRPLGRCGFSIWRKNPNVVFAVVQTDNTTVTTQGQAANKKKTTIDAGGIFRSDDKGKTWRHLNSLVPRPFYYGQIRVDPSDEKRLYVLGIQLHVSNDGGKKFLPGNYAKGTHVDYHALWINPAATYHLVLGCDGGLNFSYDRGITWQHLKNLPVAQFYAVGVDRGNPYRVYGGLQDNGSWGGPSTTREASGIALARWFNILGFDGYYCCVHPKDNDIVYCEGQYGILRRNHIRTGKSVDIKPRLDSEDAATNIVPPPEKNTPDFRFNWSSPILQSPYAEDAIFYAGNFVFASPDRGKTWQVVSPDLTRGKPGPNEHRGHTITTLAASPPSASPLPSRKNRPQTEVVLYAGTDDGKVWVCKDWNRKVWTDLSNAIPNVPQDRWITRLETSRFARGTVYLTIDRHRNDDRKPYVFKSTDHGHNWISIANNLPDDGPVQVIREDPVNKYVLYVGTELGLFISSDAGKTWHKQKHLPTVPVHDLVIHPDARELVIGTHGRAIWVMDVLPLQELNTKALATDVAFLKTRPALAYRKQIRQKLPANAFHGENAPYGAGFYFHLREKPAQAPTLAVIDKDGKKVVELKGAATAGLQRLTWSLNLPNTKAGAFRPVPAGTYTAVLTVGGAAHRQPFRVDVDD